MNRDFTEFLRATRRQRRLSQVELARRAHISERALRYWETGVSSPGLWELDSILTALELTPQERVHALALLPTRRGMALSRQESHASPALAEEYGPLPGLGDLLQAMRLRGGLTRGQVAAEMKIARSTILRWETTQSLPSEENLERLCALLGAYPEERAALSGRRMQIEEGKPHLSLEEAAEGVAALDRDTGNMHLPLVDLRALALKRQLWLLAGKSDEALLLLARVQIIHANYLVVHDRKREAEVYVQRSLNTLSGRRAPEPFWQAVVNLAAQLASEGASGNAAGMHVLNRWLPAFPREMQTTLWCDLALYAGRSRQHEAAAAYLAKAQEVLPYSSNASGMADLYYPLTRARIFLSEGRPVEALDWLPSIPDVTEAASVKASYQLLWAEALLEAGEGDAAQRHMDQLNTLLAQYPQPSRQRKLHQLADRL
ncbi:helix-turn-helix transcriptional regulator [Armatimonas sp.]|uniref:helix-turn-helix transcriptional regulator n=1 Tax=Armatimonas sp. TaxID=1872638 RepID=UPI00286A93FF|nr:helix-turn-helix transcriptional regulator [Armatimonas sp.]